MLRPKPPRPAAIALKHLGDQDYTEFRRFSEGYRGPAAKIAYPGDLRAPAFTSNHPDFRGLGCTVLSDLRVPRTMRPEVFEALTGESE